MNNVQKFSLILLLLLPVIAAAVDQSRQFSSEVMIQQQPGVHDECCVRCDHFDLRGNPERMCRQVSQVFEFNGRLQFVELLAHLSEGFRIERRLVLAELDELMRRTARLPDDMQPPCLHPEQGCPTLVQRPPLSRRLSDFIRDLGRNRSPYLAPAEITRVIGTMNHLENELAERRVALDAANAIAASGSSGTLTTGPNPPRTAPQASVSRRPQRRVGAWTSSLDGAPDEILDGSLELTQNLLLTLNRAAIRMRRERAEAASRTEAFNRSIIDELLRLSPEEQGFYARCGATADLARRNMDQYFLRRQNTDIIRYQGEALGSACRDTTNYDAEYGALIQQREQRCVAEYSMGGEDRICSPTQLRDFHVHFDRNRPQESAPPSATPNIDEPAQAPENGDAGN